MFGSVVSTAQWVPDFMGQLVFDQVVLKFQLFIQQGAGHGPEAVGGHFFFAEIHFSEDSIQGVVAQGPFAGAFTGKNIAAASEQFLLQPAFASGFDTI